MIETGDLIARVGYPETVIVDLRDVR